MLARVLYVAAARWRRRCSARSTSRTPASGRALLREIRSSFYRKLFLAFVAGAVVPVRHPRGRHAHLLRDAVARRRRGSRGADRDGRRSGWSRTTRRCSSAAPTALDAHRRSDHGARRPRHRPGREPVRPHAPAGDQRARPVRLAAAADAHAGRRLPRASCSIGCRPIVGDEQVGDLRTCSRRRRCAPADATASSPCR